MDASKIGVRNYVPNQDFGTIQHSLLITGGRFTDPLFSMYTEGEGEYRTPKELSDHPLFINGVPSRFDALQGDADDCWLVAAMEALTLNLDLIRHVVPADQSFQYKYTGIFHFRIWQLGTWYDVVVDDRLPVFKRDTRKLMNIHSRSGQVFWAALLEKAYAKVLSLRNQWHCSFKNLSISNDPQNSLQDFTGGIVEHCPTNRQPFDTSWWWFLQEVSAREGLMTCHYRVDKGGKHLGLLPSHTYAITKVFKADDNDPDYRGLYLVRVLNPWGDVEWRGWFSDYDESHWKQIDSNMRRKIGLTRREDGEFWMTQQDLVRYFERIFICHLGPGQYLQSHKAHLFYDRWSTYAINGEWVKHVSAGGADRSIRFQSPQYHMSVDRGGYYGDTYNVIIELIQHFPTGINFKPVIGVYVYNLGEQTKLHPRLDQSTLNSLSPLEEHIEFAGRTYVKPLLLEPSKYLIIPVTHSTNDEAKYLLRVYAEKGAMTMEAELVDSQIHTNKNL